MLAKAFHQFDNWNGEIESPVSSIPAMKQLIERKKDISLSGRLLLKNDDLLPVAGSIKARGGFHEVLKIAEEIAFEQKMLKGQFDDYTKLLSRMSRSVFSNYTIAVGSTGNLGLSIGMIGSKLGFKVNVHMSADAKDWKKELLRQNGVKVFEYEADYSKALKSGREQCQTDENCHFIDDENSVSLFAGYAVAALRLKQQLKEEGITVDRDNPLFVYLPCGVGGGPGGVTFGLKYVFNDAVHCFFAEPTHSPAMLIGLLTDLHNKVSVQDFGINNKTEADGLAVGRPSAFVGNLMKKLVSGVYTVEDDDLFRMLYLLYQSEKKFLEPSALAGMAGPVMVEQSDYLQKHDLQRNKDKVTHLVWATGGSLVPQEMAQDYIRRGEDSC
jgi:D-serine dehydratase